MKIEEIIKDLSKKYNKKEKVIRIMFMKSQEVGYSIGKINTIINQFYKEL